MSLIPSSDDFIHEVMAMFMAMFVFSRWPLTLGKTLCGSLLLFYRALGLWMLQSIAGRNWDQDPRIPGSPRAQALTLPLYFRLGLRGPWLFRFLS